MCRYSDEEKDYEVVLNGDTENPITVPAQNINHARALVNKYHKPKFMSVKPAYKDDKDEK